MKKPARDPEAPPSTFERIGFLLFAALPWIGFYEFTAHLHLPGRAFQFAFEDRLPIYIWTAPIYQSIYLVAAVSPWMARTRRELLRLFVVLWLAMVVVFPIYWIIPSTAPRRPLAVDGWISEVLRWERNTYPPTEAFPSFHVLWVIFLARLFRPRWLGILYAAVITVSCITTGMHYIPDVLASLALGPLLLVAADRLSRRWE
jgi:hypothetical protein